MSRQAVLIDAHGAADDATVIGRVDALTERLAGCPGQVVALLAGNGVDWLMADRAIRRAGRVALPLPTFFTDAQCRHALDAAGSPVLLTDDPSRAARLGLSADTRSSQGLSVWTRRNESAVVVPPMTTKITFTSGTTGQPKGVCLTSAQLSAVTGSLVQVARELGIRRHLCMLPLAVLLENVAGADVAIALDGECVVPPLADVGLHGSSSFDVRTALAALHRWQPDSVILLPQMLTALVAAAEAGAPVPRGLKLVAVGGARVSPDLITRARALGFPACEGYGLSEAGSVVALNRPDDAPGAVGRVLPHLRAEIAPDGEILLHGSRLAGCLGAAAPADGPLHTGDIGHVDARGCLHVTGRIKHQIITGFGRNVAPEWPEAELLAAPSVAQAVVFGEGRPGLCAVIVPRGEVTDEALAAVVRAANDRLPDYARITRWLRADAPFSALNGQATDNGRVRRDPIFRAYGERLAVLYEAPPEAHLPFTAETFTDVVS
ncbi:MAG: AMP-binding protein [Methyloversatilis sp.]|nr:AMP-binding protein [Methyloversatilis sp.]